MEDSWQSEVDIQNAEQALRRYRLQRTAVTPHQKRKRSANVAYLTIAL